MSRGSSDPPSEVRNESRHPGRRARSPWSSASSLPSCSKPAARKPAADFSLPGKDGKPVKLSALKGKVVLLDFWATWCTGCKVEIPWFIEFDKAYRAKGLAASACRWTMRAGRRWSRI